MTGERYATYWHRSTEGPIKDRVTFMAPDLPSAAGTESRDIVSFAGKTMAALDYC